MQRKLAPAGSAVLHEAAKPWRWSGRHDNRHCAIIVRALIETCWAKGGVGLAAPQIGIPKRIFVMASAGRALAFVNPVLVSTGLAREFGNEGCLSVPEAVSVERFVTAVVKAQDVNGKEFEVELVGLEARCAQHELDHLDGKLITDYIAAKAEPPSVAGDERATGLNETQASIPPASGD